MAGTSSSILTHKIGGTYAMVGQHPGGSPGGHGKIRDVDFTKVNFQKLTGDPPESQA